VVCRSRLGVGSSRAAGTPCWRDAMSALTSI
jgi:hypothetical protein